MSGSSWRCAATAVALPGGEGPRRLRLRVGSRWTHFTHQRRTEDTAKAMKPLLYVALTLSVTVPGRAFSTGAGRASCAHMKPDHIRAQPQDPRRTYVTLHTHTRSYLPGDTVAVALRSTRDFMGFLLQARSLADDRVSGAFVLTPPGSRLLGCVEDSDTVTHADKLLKRNLSFVWKAPDWPVGDVRFLVTVVQSYFVYWAGVESAAVRDVTAQPAAEGDATGATPGAKGGAYSKGTHRAITVTTQPGEGKTLWLSTPGQTSPFESSAVADGSYHFSPLNSSEGQ